MRKTLARIGGLTVLALLAWLALDPPPLPDPAAGRESAASFDDPSSHPGRSGPVVESIAVRDVDGRVAWRGDVDLGPAIARIERGDRDPHRNDGGVFGNREGLLPDRPRGYYREFVVRTPGIPHAGPQRLVVGRDGDAWYTSDHYRSFVRLDVEVRPP